MNHMLWPPQMSKNPAEYPWAILDQCVGQVFFRRHHHNNKGGNVFRADFRDLENLLRAIHAACGGLTPY